MRKISKKVSWEIAKKSFLPFLFLVCIIAAYVVYRREVSSQPLPEVEGRVNRLVATVFIAGFAVFLQRIAGAVFCWYGENVASRTTTRLDDELLPLLRRTVKTVIWIIALLVILPFYGVNISALVTALGVSSLAIALAAQDTIANIISGFMIMIDKPFRMEDEIKLPSGEQVTVIDIGVRRSKFRASDGAIIIVPNVELSKSKIVNYTYGKETST